MNINITNQNNTQKNFQAIKKIPLSTLKTQEVDKIFDTYEIISKKYNGFNANFKKDFIQKFPLLRTSFITKGFLLHTENNEKEAFHLVKSAPRSPLEIKYFKNNEQLASLKKDSENIIIDISDKFEEQLKTTNLVLNNMLEDFWEKINNELTLFANYTKFFNQIKRKIKPQTTKNEIKILITEEQKKLQIIPAVADTQLKPEITSLHNEYNNLHKTIYQRNGAFTARFKEAYFGKSAPHEKGITFNIDTNRINIMPVKSSEENSNALRAVIFDKNNTVISAFVLCTSGIVKEIKHKENYKKLMDFNLKALSQEEVKGANISKLLTILSNEIKKYKEFINEYTEKYQVVRHKKDFKTKAEIAIEKENKTLEKQELIKSQQETRLLEKLKKKEERLKLKAEQKKLKEEEKKHKKNKIKIQAKPQKQTTKTPLSKLYYSKDVNSFSDINIATLVELIKGVFATPVEKRNPHFSHELLNNNKIFSGRFFIKAKDGTKVSVTKIKSARYVDFEYYSIKTEKNGISQVINIDPITNDIIYTTTDGKILITDERIRHISKAAFAEKFPECDKIAQYIKELFNNNTKGKIVKSDLKIKNKPSNPDDIVNAELRALDNLPFDFQNIDTLW